VFRYGTVYKRAEQLKDAVLKAMEEWQVEKVNIIGHSMGGLDARFVFLLCSRDFSCHGISALER
jgi:triacylglycerol esterase/lipase EstA (alpha/beta hydrolase family)